MASLLNLYVIPLLFDNVDSTPHHIIVTGRESGKNVCGTMRGEGGMVPNEWFHWHSAVRSR
jgi:hypothetical protein